MFQNRRYQVGASPESRDRREAGLVRTRHTRVADLGDRPLTAADLGDEATTQPRNRPLLLLTTARRWPPDSKDHNNRTPPLTFRTYQSLPHTNSYFHRLYSSLDLLPQGPLGYPRGAKPPWYPRS